MLLELFFSFFKIGLFTFGGGYAMIPLVKEVAVNTFNLSESLVYNFIAISESTPGPIAINMATFVGYCKGGILGAFFATFGVVLPSFIIILLIVALISNLLKFKGFQAFMNGVRPVVIGLIISTGLTIFLLVVFSIKNVNSAFCFDWKALVIFTIIFLLFFLCKKLYNKTFSPIILILISAFLGIMFYGVI